VPKKPEVMSPAGHCRSSPQPSKLGDACYFGLKHFSAAQRLALKLSELTRSDANAASRGVLII